MASRRYKKQSMVRLEWIREQAEELKAGPITAEFVETGLKTASKESFKAALPFVKGKVAPEAVLYVDVPVASRHTDTLHVAQPLSKKGRVSLPVQLSCITEGNLPSTVFFTREGWVAAHDEKDPLLAILTEDEAFVELLGESFTYKYPASLDGRTTVTTGWGVCADQLTPNRVLCVLNTGTDVSGVFVKKRVYDLKLRFLLLTQMMRDIRKLGYFGETVLLETPPVYEVVRQKLKAIEPGAGEFQPLLAEPSATTPHPESPVAQMETKPPGDAWLISLQEKISEVERKLQEQQDFLFRLDRALMEGRVESAAYQELKDPRVDRVEAMEKRLTSLRTQLEEGANPPQPDQARSS